MAWSGGALAIPLSQVLAALEIQQCLESCDVVFNHRKILILNGAADLDSPGSVYDKLGLKLMDHSALLTLLES